MKILIYSNCQGEAIKQILEMQDKNIKISSVSNYDCIVNNKPISINFINKHDILLYQPIKKERGKHSTDYILNNINKNVKCISFPYIYNTGMWCIVLNNNNLKNGFNNSYLHFDEHTIISGLEAIKDNHNNNLLDDFYNNRIDFNLKKRFFDSLDKLKNMEKNTDIKICDFIKNNYKKMQMFYRDCHPSVNLISEITYRICKKIDIDFVENKSYELSDFNMLTNGYIPITPVERKELGLEFEIPLYFKKENEQWKTYYFNLFTKIFN